MTRHRHHGSGSGALRKRYGNVADTTLDYGGFALRVRHVGGRRTGEVEVSIQRPGTPYPEKFVTGTSRKDALDKARAYVDELGEGVI